MEQLGIVGINIKTNNNKQTATMATNNANGLDQVETRILVDLCLHFNSEQGKNKSAYVEDSNVSNYVSGNALIAYLEKLENKKFFDVLNDDGDYIMSDKAILFLKSHNANKDAALEKPTFLKGKEEKPTKQPTIIADGVVINTMKDLFGAIESHGFTVKPIGDGYVVINDVTLKYGMGELYCGIKGILPTGKIQCKIGSNVSKGKIIDQLNGLILTEHTSVDNIASRMMSTSTTSSNKIKFEDAGFDVESSNNDSITLLVKTSIPCKLKVHADDSITMVNPVGSSPKYKIEDLYESLAKDNELLIQTINKIKITLSL